MICYVLAMGKQHLGPHVVVGYGIKIFWPGLFITSSDHLEAMQTQKKEFSIAFIKYFSILIRQMKGNFV